MGRIYRRLAALLLIWAVLASGLFLIGTAAFEADAADLSPSGAIEVQAADILPPSFRLLSPSENEYQIDTLQTVKILITDDVSGVDASSIEYRITTQGPARWSQWLPYKDADDGPSTVVTLRENFRRGSENYVQVRAVDLSGTNSATSRPFNIKVNSFPVIVIDSPVMGDPLMEGAPVVFDASGTYDPEGDRVHISWFRSTPDGLSHMGDGEVISVPLQQGEHTITVVASDDLYNEVRASFTISVKKPPVVVDPDSDLDMDGIPDLWEVRFQSDPYTPDSQLDTDGDGYTNLEEYLSQTNPLNKVSRPIENIGTRRDDALPLFSLKAWPLWAIFALAVISVLMTMFVVRTKADRQVRRLSTVRRKLRVTPSVPLEQVTATVSIAPLTGTMALRVLRGRARQAALPPPKPVEQMLPPAEIKKREKAPAPEEEAAPEPEEDVHLSQAGTIPPPARGAEVPTDHNALNINDNVSISGYGVSVRRARDRVMVMPGPGPDRSGDPSGICSCAAPSILLIPVYQDKIENFSTSNIFSGGSNEKE